MHILVTGASGYIGGRLIPQLAAAGHRLTCLVRDPARLGTHLPEGVEVRQADLLDPASLPQALAGVNVAYYLVHSMADGVKGYIERDHQAALNFARAAAQSGVQRIIYLGGLGSRERSLSPHLEARQRVGELLRTSGIPITEFRAAIVIGSGSMSFEMIRYLTERLPILPTPPWITTLCQPIAIRNVLDYLYLSLDEPLSTGETFEIGGPDVLTYQDIMRAYAQRRGLKRHLVRLPLLTPLVLALGARLVTPLPHPYLHILIEGLRSEVVVQDPKAETVFNLDLIPYDQALRQALERDGNGEVRRTWAGSPPGLSPGRTHRMTEGIFIDQRRLSTRVSPTAVYRTLLGMGGVYGWFYAEWLWRLRGWLDLRVGGVGIRRLQRSRDDFQPGDVAGSYSVEAVLPGHLIRLCNEMKTPGPSWMQFEVQAQSGGGSLFILTAFFEPHGLAGLVYWYTLSPFHQLVFRGMAKAIVRQAERAESEPGRG